MSFRRVSPRRQGRRRGRIVAAAVLSLGIALATSGAEFVETLPGPIETDTAVAAAVAARNGGEVLHLRWQLTGFLGLLAGLFVPNSGDGLLTFVPQPDEQMRIQMLITAPKREGEYFLYGADIDERSGSTAEVWSAYEFRGERKNRGQRVEAPDVIDFASAIHHLRRHPPDSVRRMTIWNGGKTYPCEVEPLETEMRKIAGEKRAVRGYLVRGVKIKGKPAFEDKYILYFSQDDRATPVEILGKRGLIRVRFQFVEEEGSGGA